MLSTWCTAQKTVRVFYIVILHLPFPDFVLYIFFIWRQLQLLVFHTILSCLSLFTYSSDVSGIFFHTYLVPLFESTQWISCLFAASASLMNYWELLMSGSLMVTFWIRSCRLLWTVRSRFSSDVFADCFVYYPVTYGVWNFNLRVIY